MARNRKYYDVIITIPNVRADSKEEAEEEARKDAQTRGFVKITEVK